MDANTITNRRVTRRNYIWLHKRDNVRDHRARMVDLPFQNHAQAGLRMHRDVIRRLEWVAVTRVRDGLKIATLKTNPPRNKQQDTKQGVTKQEQSLNTKIEARCILAISRQLPRDKQTRFAFQRTPTRELARRFLSPIESQCACQLLRQVKRSQTLGWVHCLFVMPRGIRRDSPFAPLSRTTTTITERRQVIVHS